MFWKLVLTIAVVVLLSGRTGLVRNPLLRLLLPRSWVARLPVPPPRPRPTSSSPVPEQNPEARPSSGLGTRVYIFLVVVSATAVAAWVITKALIEQAATTSP